MPERYGRYTCIAIGDPDVGIATAPRDRAAARRSGQEDWPTKSFYAREAILEKIEDLEDAYLANERNRTDSGERISLDAMMERYADDLKANP